jgi:nucleoside-diphosphate-sugar epimerase
MANALIIGGRGQSGRAIAAQLVTDGWRVTATTRGEVSDDLAAPDVRWVHRDADGPDLATIVGTDVDVLVHTTAFDVTDAQELIGLGDRVGSVVALSSVSVYSDDQGRSLDEAVDEATFPAWPVPIPESWVTVAPGAATYSTRKVALEEALREGAPWPVTIVRPGVIHGSHSRHLREWYFIKRVLDRRECVVLPYGGTSIFQPTASVNLAALVALAAARPGDRTLNSGDLDPPSVTRISEVIDELMGWTTQRVLVDGPEPGPNVGNNPWAVPRPVVVDMSSALAELGYVQRASYDGALSDTLRWALDACRERDWREVFPQLAKYYHDLFDYEAEDAYLDHG